MKTKNKNPGRPPSSTSSRATCERLTDALNFVVTPQALAWWKKKSYPLDDLNALRWRILSQERHPEGCDLDRLRRDMRRPVLFGRAVREVIEEMPLQLIDDLDAATDRRGKFVILAEWVANALRELGTREDHPPGLRLTTEEVAEVIAYRAEQAGEV